MKISISSNKIFKTTVSFLSWEDKGDRLLSKDSSLRDIFEISTKENFISKKVEKASIVTQNGLKVFYFPLVKPPKKTMGSAYDIDYLRTTLSNLYSLISDEESVHIDLSDIQSILSMYHIKNTEEAIEAITEGLLYNDYQYSEFKKKPKVLLKEIFLHGIDTNHNSSIEKIQSIMKGVYFTRDLAITPSNICNSDYILKETQKKGEEAGFKVTYMDQKELENEKLSGLLSVNLGSKNPPYIVSCHYKPKNPKKKVLLVGKGVTYDTGGYSLKPSEGMLGMKYDMHGAASVLGAMVSIANLKGEEVEVIAMVGLVENMVNENAQKPGDINRHYNGLSVEVDNTDAEGRLVLSDVLSYGIKTHEPDITIDLATLTGACSIALGHLSSAILTNHKEYSHLMLEAGRKTGEVCWMLPLFEEYLDQLKSPIADLKNIGGRAGGTITAGKFLEQFIYGKPWIHIDIANTANIPIDLGYRKKGINGVGPKLLSQFIQDIS